MLSNEKKNNSVNNKTEKKIIATNELVIGQCLCVCVCDGQEAFDKYTRHQQ